MNVSSQKGIVFSLWTFAPRVEPVPLRWAKSCSAVVAFACKLRLPWRLRSILPARVDRGKC
ncbi:TPA: hypothetical protein ACKRPK_005190, partial [Pseudomonas aeruginosa]